MPDGAQCSGSAAYEHIYATSRRRQDALDLIVLANLRKLEAASGRAIMAQLLASFSTVTPSRFAALRAAIATGDAYAIDMEAHTLKGSSASMGARRMAAVWGLEISAKPMI